MKFISKDMAGKSGSAIEYDGDPDINLARIELSGRYPEKGWALNTKAKMLCYILEGGGSLHFEDADFEFESGDTFLIEPDEKYYWDADTTLIIASTPAWTKEQAKVED